MMAMLSSVVGTVKYQSCPMSEFAVLDLDPGVSQHRSRLLEGMAHAVAAKGYAETTIADIVREASVSRRTFYEHFATKAECLVALYDAASRNALKVLRDAIDPARDWEAQVETATSAYLAAMAANPVLLRTLYIEILGLGPVGLAARRRVNQEIADFILAVVAAGHGKPLAPQMATAIVGGINELVLQYIEQDRVDHLQEVVAPAGRLVRAVAGTH
jgi:AcrR family transcriptional regulator